MTQWWHIAKLQFILRTLLSTKDKVPEVSNIPLNADCSANLLNTLPEKLGDTGRFILPCSIYQSGTIYSLVDLSASINLMPYSQFQKLRIGNLNPTKMSIQLADQSTRYPKRSLTSTLGLSPYEPVEKRSLS
ncbi:uncharacterized protein [Rutidosis leptorrhynchoides]|uniref:uncharacterized protein n=1 Tax=Rutidosis leptorrhynchoides TaxID=125765 RepID=UPI003A995B31